MNLQFNNKIEKEEYSKKKINKKNKSQNIKGSGKDKIVEIIGYKISDKKNHEQKKKNKNFINSKRKFHENVDFLNKKSLQLKYKVDIYKFKDFKDKLGNFENVQLKKKSINLHKEFSNKKIRFLFSKKRKKVATSFLESLFISNFLESQDDVKPFLYNYFSPITTSVSFKQLFSLVYVITSRIKSRRLYLYSDQQKVLEYLNLLVSEAEVNKLAKVGGNTEIKSWLLERNKDRVLISLSDNISTKFSKLVLNKNIYLNYYVNGFYNSLKNLPMGSYFLMNDILNDFKKIMFLLQFIKIAAKMYMNKRSINRGRYKWMTKHFQKVYKKNNKIKKHLKISLSKLYMNRYKLKRLFKVKSKRQRFYNRIK